MRNRRLYPPLQDPCYLHLTDLRVAVAAEANRVTGDVVDFGSGSKPYRSLFPNVARYRGADFEVEDPDDIAIESTGRLPLPEASADWVLSFQVLEHVPDPAWYLSECRRILRPGGGLILSTHGTWPYHPGPRNGDYWRWTAEGLGHVVHQSGFSVSRVEDLTRGGRALIQLAQVTRDPFRHRRSWLRRRLKSCYCLSLNLAALALEPCWGKYNRNSDLVAIGCLAVARAI